MGSDLSVRRRLLQHLGLGTAMLAGAVPGLARAATSAPQGAGGEASAKETRRPSPTEVRGAAAGEPPRVSGKDAAKDKGAAKEMALPPNTMRIGLTPVFLDHQTSFLNDWRDYLAAELNRPVEFVQRDSYREVVDLLRQNKIHFAWLCGYPLVRNRARMRLLAVPVYQGRPLYQSYLIVPARDKHVRQVFDLKDRVFVYSDPDSNSGHLYPQYQLLNAKANPATFFRRSFFAYSHRNVVEAVAAGLANGGAVDGYVWDSMQLIHPELTAKTRVADRSPTFGFPPFVAALGVSAADSKALQAVLFDMHQHVPGRELLQRLNLDGFEPGSVQLYDGIEKMARVVNADALVLPPGRN